MCSGSTPVFLSNVKVKECQRHYGSLNQFCTCFQRANIPATGGISCLRPSTIGLPLCWSSTAGASVRNLGAGGTSQGHLGVYPLHSHDGRLGTAHQHSWMNGLVVHDWIITFPTQGYSDETIPTKRYGLFHALVTWDPLGSFLHIAIRIHWIS